MEPMKIRSIIVEDDPFIHNLLNDLIGYNFPNVEIVGTSNNGTEGIEKIKKLKPDLVFLDVEMADMTGFEMLSKLEDIHFQTIFINSYSHYAIKAIRFNALDYLVKPIDLGELKAAIRRYQEKAKSEKPAGHIKQALVNMNTPSHDDKILLLQTQDGEMRLPLKDIIRAEGERNYSYIYLNNGKKKLTTKTLGDLEEVLDDKGFFRCHKSHLVNVSHIKSQPTSVSLLLSDDSILPVSRRKKENFKKWYEGAKS
jgi:two-component system LytT family response regulator